MRSELLLQQIHWDVSLQLDWLSSHPDLNLRQQQDHIISDLAENIPAHKNEFVDRLPILPFPVQTIAFNPKTNSYEFQLPTGEFTSEYTNSKERHGAYLIGLRSVAEKLKDSPPNTSMVLISPSGSDFTGGQLPETQIYFYNWNGSEVQAATIRLPQIDLQQSEILAQKLGYQPKSPEYLTRIFDLSSTPFTTTLEKFSHEISAAFGQSPEKIAYQINQTLSGNKTPELDLESQVKLANFLSSIALTQSPEEIAHLLQNGLYDLIISINTPHKSKNRASVHAYIEASSGCMSVGSSSAIESSLVVGGEKYKFIHHCGNCKISLYKWMKKHDRCPCCRGEYLGC